DTLAVEVDSFHLQVSKTMDFADTLYSKRLYGTDHEYTLNTALDYDSTYYWRVVTYDSLSIFIESSDVYSFTVQGIPPAQPKNISPASATIDAGLNPTLTWSAVPDADNYHVQVSIYQNFSDSSFVATVPAPSTSVNVNVPLEAYTVYYWRVAASNQNGLGEWSLFWNFTTLYTGLHLPQGDFGAAAFPNPAQSNMTLSFMGEGAEGSVKLFDMQGKEVARLAEGFFAEEQQQVDINREGLEAGMYMLRLEQNGRYQTLKVVFE
ncbi:MAG: T9SS type A sorting domain-containing protein, partial [Bacteroidota bacterium]|nr:T9SS type A sorting domain-containing protein [Bacteroidota bacterium]MDX5431842.1 T9SS type A sorting domain-containing protein [Bacteroidota bacterium]MDX5470553.1 T9SS type A sorting domain-containing protein [Bacteroidota bacterium]